MAGSIGEFISDLLTEVDSTHPAVEPALRRATVRALNGLSMHRVLFMEATFQFTTVVDQADYAAADSGFPADAADFDSVYVVSGTSTVPLVQLTIDRLREGATSSATSGGMPRVYAFHHQTMILAPTPGAAWIVKGDYAKDGRRDAATGNPILWNDTTSGNAWFGEGEGVLRDHVLMDFYASSVGAKPERASECRTQYAIGLNELKAAYSRKRVRGVRAPAWLGESPDYSPSVHPYPYYGL